MKQANVKRESDIEKYFVKRIKEEGGKVRKVKWIGRRNAPDRFIMLNGKSAFVELKRPGKKPTVAQERELKCLEDSGMHATWVNCERNIDRMIDFMMDRKLSSFWEEVFKC